MIKIVIPEIFKEYAGNECCFEISADSIENAFKDLVRNHPQLAGRLLESDGAPMPFIFIVNGEEQMEWDECSSLSVSSNSKIHLITGVAGG